MKLAPHEQHRNDAEALIRMALDRSSSARNALARSVADICLDDHATLSAREIALTFEILCSLVRHMEMRVRRDLAQRLAPRRDAPRDLIVLLANDQIDVAYPILVESEVLEDADLIAIVRERRTSHQIAITLRERVSAALAQALVETDNLDVIDSLMRNPAAEFAPRTMRRLVEMSRDAPSLQRPLLERHDLSADLAWRMANWVAGALKEFIADNFSVEYDAIEQEIDRAARGVAAVGGAADQGDIARRVAEQERVGGLTAGALIRTLCEEDIELFEAMFARVTGIDAVAMPVIVYDPGGEPFAIACKACDFAPRDFEQLYLLLTNTLAGEHETDPEEFNRIRGYYRKLDAAAARSVVDEWRQAPSKAWQTA